MVSEADRLVVLEGLQKLQWSHVFSDMVSLPGHLRLCV
ncbi:protein of unknown function [Methanoculleus bourgensis]|uniref:Uncharacterized protein n=1 Tax=Methanoculleus bourgensis TaxID=83986 RepID=A0A120N6U3_9EURY|nr:protein of unknown function [Methanoculleus bourgensis]